MGLIPHILAPLSLILLFDEPFVALTQILARTSSVRPLFMSFLLAFVPETVLLNCRYVTS